MAFLQNSDISATEDRSGTQFITKINYEDLPQEAVAAFKWVVLDYLGVALAGSGQPVGKYVEGLVKENKCSGEVTVIASGAKTSNPRCPRLPA